MSQIEIVSINVGKPATLNLSSKEISTGIMKTPVHGALYLSHLNFEGDGQADLKFHGGKDKAVCVYPYEHYAYWENELGIQLAYGAFGENLTIRGLKEADVCIGDVFQLGEAVVQVTQPRQPCYKLSARYGDPDLPLKVQNTGYTGYYFRVLTEGTVSAVGGLVPVSRHPKAVTVAFANEIMHHRKNDEAGIRTILEVDELSDSWKKTLRKRLEGEEGSTKERLTGNL
ncbi:MOSC domain-containing protein [Paenibacillus ginsengihumi]|uniref:MOSC domain-containing protein n=1 Tax=Paenibacillus ginsengihumi TaxID=431596 RepID=UPI00037712FA|nr:MOSC domain-containing protein [Paenibacillus ginsengihumi]